MTFRLLFSLFGIGLIAITLPLHLNSEITDVTITWRAVSCRAGCDTLLIKQFSKVYGVSSIDINLNAGQANLKWKPNVPFSFHPLDDAMRLVGPHISNLRVKVRGKIKHDDISVRIVSEGDGTEFYLLSPILPSNTQYTPTTSYYNRGLNPEVRNQLLDLEAKKLMVVIDGPLFQPYRSPPLLLTTEHIGYEEQK